MKTKFLLPLCTVLSPSLLHAETAITMYNRGFGVIRETLPIALKAGENTVTFDRATAQVQTDSVIFRDAKGVAKFTILEQNYRNDPVSEQMMLKHFEGKEVSFVGYKGSEKIVTYPVKIIRAGEGSSLLLEIDGKLRFGEPSGNFIFPSLADDSILRPTLTWKLAAEAASQFDAQVSYMTGGFSWKADYNLVAQETGETLTITGWVTLENKTGASFTNAMIKLMAGDVQITAVNADPFMAPEPMKMRAADSLAGSPVQEKAFDDFHLYTLPRALDLKNEETKQVEFLRSAKVQARKTYLYIPYNRKEEQVEVAWEFENTEANGLGVPLPAGKMRVYREDSADKNLEFIGENTIKHTAQKEKIRLVTGTAFDLVATSKRINEMHDEARKTASYTDQMVITNRSKAAKTVKIRAYMNLQGKIEVTKCSETYESVDAKTVEIDVTVQPDEKKTVSLSVRSEW